MNTCMCDFAIPVTISGTVVLTWARGACYVGTLSFCSAPPGDTQPDLKSFLFVTVGVSGEGDRVLGV